MGSPLRVRSFGSGRNALQPFGCRSSRPRPPNPTYLFPGIGPSTCLDRWSSAGCGCRGRGPRVSLITECVPEPNNSKVHTSRGSPRERWQPLWTKRTRSPMSHPTCAGPPGRSARPPSWRRCSPRSINGAPCPFPLHRLTPHSLSRRVRDLLAGHLGAHRRLPVDATQTTEPVTLEPSPMLDRPVYSRDDAQRAVSPAPRRLAGHRGGRPGLGRDRRASQRTGTTNGGRIGRRVQP